MNGQTYDEWTDEQKTNMINNYKFANEQLREQVAALKEIEKREFYWRNEQANIYMDLGELELVLFSEEKPAAKVKKCKEIIKAMNDPEHLEQFVG